MVLSCAFFFPKQEHYTRGQIVKRSRIGAFALRTSWSLTKPLQCPSYSSNRTFHTQSNHHFDPFVRCKVVRPEKIHYLTQILSVSKLVLLSQLFKVYIVNEQKRAISLTSLLIVALPTFLTVKDTAGSLSSTIVFYLLSWVPALAPVFSRELFI